jgi:hypothetical protein
MIANPYLERHKVECVEYAAPGHEGAKSEVKEAVVHSAANILRALCQVRRGEERCLLNTLNFNGFFIRHFRLTE